MGGGAFAIIQDLTLAEADDAFSFTSHMHKTTLCMSFPHTSGLKPSQRGSTPFITLYIDIYTSVLYYNVLLLCTIYGQMFKFTQHTHNYP